MLSMIPNLRNFRAQSIPSQHGRHFPLSGHTAPVPEPIEDPLPGEHPVPQEDPVPSPNPEIDDPKSLRKAVASIN